MLTKGSKNWESKAGSLSGRGSVTPRESMCGGKTLHVISEKEEHSS
jgi:hypothetical protein